MVFDILAGAFLSIASPASDTGYIYIRERYLLPCRYEVLPNVPLKVLCKYTGITLLMTATCNKADLF